ncbi:MAG: hypothetical protein Kow0042_04860 [Calditrichia bacterium]
MGYFKNIIWGIIAADKIYFPQFECEWLPAGLKFIQQEFQVFFPGYLTHTEVGCETGFVPANVVTFGNDFIYSPLQSLNLFSGFGGKPNSVVISPVFEIMEGV